MTEEDWLACRDPAAMLAYLRGKASDRKLRLFACACCRRVWPLLKFEASRQAVETAERCAEDGGRLERARLSANIPKTSGLGGTTTYPASRAALASADASPFRAAAGASEFAAAAGTLTRERAGQVTLLRCVFGNHFHPASPDPSWLTSTVLALAASVYESRAFHDLPVLADALEEAGCGDEVALAHLRGGGPHARGCWVVDLLLGKT